MLKELISKRDQRIIQEIHDAFDNAQEVLLERAKTTLLSIDTQTIIDDEKLSERFKKIGFVNVPVVKEVGKNKALKDEKLKLYGATKKEANLIEYYKHTYPFLKFLTESELDVICKKYNLVYAPVRNYIKPVPVKNLTEIENAQELKYADYQERKCIFQYNGDFNRRASQDIRNKLIKGIEIFDYDQNMSNNSIARKYVDRGHPELFWGDDSLSGPCTFDYFKKIITTIDKEGLFICAPQSHFDTSGLKRKGLGFFTMREVKDPIVFRYVKGGVQVLSKWGLEANDEMLVNPLFN